MLLSKNLSIAKQAERYPETNIDLMVRKFVAPIKLVNKRLDVQEEVARIKQGLGKK
jgi:hypothetical protein